MKVYILIRMDGMDASIVGTYYSYDDAKLEKNKLFRKEQGGGYRYDIVPQTVKGKVELEDTLKKVTDMLPFKD